MCVACYYRKLEAKSSLWRKKRIPMAALWDCLSSYVGDIRARHMKDESSPGKHDTTRRPTFLKNKTENSTVMRSHNMLYHAWWTAPSTAHWSQHNNAQIRIIIIIIKISLRPHSFEHGGVFRRRRSDQTSVWYVKKNVWYHLSNVWICRPPPHPLYLQPGARLKPGKGTPPQTHTCKSALWAPELRIVSHLCGSAATSVS